MILITGAAGKTGQAIIKSLVARGQHVRGLVRSEEQGKELDQVGVSDTVVGDMGAVAALEKAVKGVRAVYHICPNMHPRELYIGKNMVQAARSAGVELFVYHSVLHPQVEAMPHHWQKMRVEEMLFTSGLSYTILQPAAYMQNVLANWDRVVTKGVYAIPYSTEAKMSMVDLQDVAEVASAVLTEPGHAGAVYELCGPEIHTHAQIAPIIAAFLERDVKAVEIPFERWERQARAAGLSDYAVNTLVAMFRYYDQFGFWGNGQVLGWLLGRSPTTFEQFLRRILS
jgi:uncharacterized protein YbjT (DUF2867 family)